MVLFRKSNTIWTGPPNVTPLWQLANMMEPPHAQHTGAPSRYDDLLRQIVHLNTDLQKTAALSQTLQRERDGLQHNNSKVRGAQSEAMSSHCGCNPYLTLAHMVSTAPVCRILLWAVASR